MELYEGFEDNYESDPDEDQDVLVGKAIWAAIKVLELEEKLSQNK